MEPKFQVVVVLVVQTLLNAVGAMPILAPTTTLNETDIVETTANSSLEAAAHYFNDTESEKAQPIYRCEPDRNGFIYRFPASATCPLPNRNKPFAVVNITTFIPSMKYQEFDGYECYSTKQPVELRGRWFQIPKMWYGFMVRGPPPSFSECRTMVEDRRAPDGKPMLTDMASRGLFYTLDDTRPGKPGYLRTEYATRKDYYFRKIPLSVNDITMKLMTVVSVTESCDSQRGWCPAAESVIIWNPKDVMHCNFQVSRETSCILTDNQLTCPSNSMAITKMTKVELCGATMGFSAQGILYSVEHPEMVCNINRIICETYSTQLVKAKIVPKRKRWKRDISGLKENGFASQSEMASMFQFLHDLVETRRIDIVERLQLQICSLAKIAYSLAVNKAVTSPGGDVSAFVRSVRGRDNLRARLAGDVIVEEPCLEIRNYVFEWDPSSCYEYPTVRYISNNHSYLGFLIPGTRVIVDNSLTCNSKYPPRLYFDAGKEGVLSINDKRFVELNKIPVPTFSEIKAVEYPPTIFGSDATVTMDGVKNLEHKLLMHRRQQEMQAHDSAIHNDMQDKLMKEKEEFNLFSKKVAMSFIINVLDSIPTAIKAFCLFILFLILVSVCGYVKELLPTKSLGFFVRGLFKILCAGLRRAAPAER